MAFLLLHNYTDFIYQTQSAQILFIFIDFLNFVALILVYLCTNPNNRGIDKIACVK